jgi:hypothetical protein
VQKFGDYPLTFSFLELDSTHYVAIPSQSKAFVGVCLQDLTGEGSVFDFAEQFSLTLSQLNTSVEVDRQQPELVSIERKLDVVSEGLDEQPTTVSKFVEENDPRYKEDVSLDYFIEYCASLIHTAKKSMKLTNVDSKLYYKLRHNLFKTCVLQSLGFVSVKERSFKEVSGLGLDSNKTPDFLELFGNTCILIEFTVSNTEAAVLRNKDYFTKYSDEVRKSLVTIDDHYLSLTLQSDCEDVISQVYDISKKTGLPVNMQFREDIEQVLNTIKTVTAYFNDFAPEVLSLNNDVLEINLPIEKLPDIEIFREVKNLRGRGAIKEVRVKNLVMRHVRRLTQALRRRPSDAQYRVCVNFVTSSCYIDESSNGIDKDLLLNLLDQGTFDLIPVHILGDYYVENTIFAGVDVGIVDPIERVQDYTVKIDTDSYEDRHFTATMKSKMKTVADTETVESIPLAVSVYNSKLRELNMATSVVHYRSSPFIFYPCDTLTKGEFNVEVNTGSRIFNLIMSKAKGKNTIDSKIIDRKIDYNALDKLNTEVARTGYLLRRKYGQRFKEYTNMRKDKFKVKLQEFPDLLDIQKFREVKSRYNDVVIENTRVFYKNRFRINLKRDLVWEDETTHFRKAKNVHRVVKGCDSAETLDDYRQFLTEIFETTAVKMSDEVMLDTEPLGAKLASYCAEMRIDAAQHTNIFSSTRLGHSTLLISQVCYSLMYYSNIKLNKDDFVYDNLGYEGVLLVVKGGKKIRSTRTSRFFKLMIPVTKIQSKLVASASNTVVLHNEQHYLVTPWRMLRMSYLKKGLEMYHNLGCYYASAMLEYNLSKQETEKFMSMKVLLMFSQKRSLEVWSSILRYIYLNSLGTHTDLLSLIPDMVMHDSNTLVYLLQRQFVKSLSSINSEAAQDKLYDIIWETSVNNFDLAAERFEESLFMSRAPFNPVAEHLKNLKSILETHDYFMTKVGTSDPKEIYKKTNVELGDDYFDNLESNDFNFDSKLTYILGDYAGSYLSSVYSVNDLNEEFNNIMNVSYTSIATGKGMRDTHSSNFYGKKGHDVVFKNFKSKDVRKMISDFPKNPSEFNRFLSEREVSFFDKINSLGEYELVFDAKDKEQYKGSREIYVMSHDTKLMQNPLEKFFAKLCKAFPNELIHKPSSSRPKFIHSRIFEHDYEGKKVMYCTMDCRKWAPRSNLWKYYVFVKGMARYLPESFVGYFFTFWPLMFKKKVRIQNKFVELLRTNEGYKEMVEKYLIPSGEDTHDLLMPYSFMMGIFNYLSSLMHAASQVYFSEKIAPRLSASSNFLAHSDDSGGVIVAKDYNACLRVYKSYEMFQRGLNHLMSRKKCCLSERSFEMISIMYNKKRFIPMVHKFITNVSLEPTGSGWYSDVCTIVGKVVDLYNNGGSLLQCYIMMLSLGELYRKAYHLPRTPLLSKIPLAFGGVFNCHPIHLILIGSSCQESLLDLVESQVDRDKRVGFFLSFSGDYSLGVGSRLTYRIPYYKRHDDLLDLDEADRPKLDALSTLPMRSTILDYVKHLNRLYDPKYVYSLTGVDINQILLSTLYYPTTVRYLNEKDIKIQDLCKIYHTTYLSERNFSVSHTYPIGGHSSYFKQVENLGYSYKKVSVESNKSCKPVRYSTIENHGLRVSQENLMLLSAVEKWPEIKRVLTNSEKFDSMKRFCLNSLPGEMEDKLNYLKNFDPSEKDDKIRSGYLFIPSQVRIDNASRFFAYSMLYTTRRYKVSTQKPQLYTPTDLSNFDTEIEEIKHTSLCYKLLTSKSATEGDVEKILNSIKNCPRCSSIYAFKDVELFLSMSEKNEFTEFECELPFVDYVTSQFRGKNIWYSRCDFDIITNYGTIEARTKDGDMHTTWRVADDNNLPKLWQLYTQFCKSRGIGLESIVYQDSGTQYSKLAFNDFSAPHKPPLNVKCMVLPHSKIMTGSVPRKRVHRRGKYYYIGDRAVDFMIYAVYDVNEEFYNTHGLESIKSLLYNTDLNVDKTILLSNFSASRTYKILMNDERHFSVQQNKYTRNGFLCQPGSLTRSLVLADEKNELSYRTSYRPEFVTKGALEFDTVGGVPVMDMFEKCSFSRLSLTERISFGKVLDGQDLSYRDKENLLSLKNRMGLEALGTALTMYKHVMRGMLANSASSLPVGLTVDLLTKLLDTIHSCMSEFPSSKYYRQYEGKARSFWSAIESIYHTDKDWGLFPSLLAQGILRARSDNHEKFWSCIRDDPLLSCLPINNKYYANLILFIRGMLSRKEVVRGLKGALYADGKPKYRHLALAMNYATDMDDSDGLISVVTLKQGDEIVLDEDALDALGGGDSLEDIMDDDDLEIKDRKWKGKTYRATVCCIEDIKKVMEDTAQKNYSRITILCPTNYICFPWFDQGDYEFKNIRGVEFYVSEFPGEQNYPGTGESKIQSVEQRTFSELVGEIKDIEKKVEEKKLYLPRSLRSISEARAVLSKMNILNPSLLNVCFEGDDKNWLEESLKDFVKLRGFEDQVHNVTRRERVRHHLPGFQGLLQDKKIVAELVSIFGPNAHYLFSGNVRLTEKSYNYFMRAIKRLYNSVGADDRAILLLLISTMLDTVTNNDSDGWYTDVITGILDDMERKVEDPEDILIMPVSVKPMTEDMYVEKDLFD